MPFKKGTSGNPIGRPVGSISNSTKLLREQIGLDYRWKQTKRYA